MINLLIIVALIFVGYAIYRYYSMTPYEYSVPKRVWASIVAAIAAIGAWIAAAFQQGGIPS